MREERRRKWTSKEDGFLIKKFGKMTAIKIGKQLGRSAASVHLRGYRLQLKGDGTPPDVRYSKNHREKRLQQYRDQYTNHRELRLQQNIIWRKKNPERSRQIVAKSYDKNRAAINFRERTKYQREKEALVRAFGGDCAICGYDLFQSALDIHHVTQENIMLLCANCHRAVSTGEIEIADENGLTHNINEFTWVTSKVLKKKLRGEW